MGPQQVVDALPEHTAPRWLHRDSKPSYTIPLFTFEGMAVAGNPGGGAMNLLVVLIILLLLFGGGGFYLGGPRVGGGLGGLILLILLILLLTGRL